VPRQRGRYDQGTFARLRAWLVANCMRTRGPSEMEQAGLVSVLRQRPAESRRYPSAPRILSRPGSCPREVRAGPALTSAGGPPGFHCPRSRRRRGSVASETACRTSCRNAPGTALELPSSVAHSRCVRRAPRQGCSRSRTQTNSPARPTPCWSVRYGARPWELDAPDSCPAEANDLPGQQKSRRRPKSFSTPCAETGSRQPSDLLCVQPTAD
jgi:hypothetical protein